MSNMNKKDQNNRSLVFIYKLIMLINIESAIITTTKSEIINVLGS